MIGVTIASPGYRDLAHHQADHFRKNSGLNTIVVETVDDGYHHKLELQSMFKGQQVVFFDADYRLIRPINFRKLNPFNVFIAASDPGHLHQGMWASKDSGILGIDKSKYFNSGFWMANFANASHVRAFNLARQMLEEKKNGLWSDIGDPGDQSFMNAAMQRSGVQMSILHPKFNFFMHAWEHGCIESIPRGVIGIHAAGVPLDQKSAHLDSLDTMLSRRRNHRPIDGSDIYNNDTVTEVSSKRAPSATMDWGDYHNLHKGEDAIILGKGPSAAAWAESEHSNQTIIAINDAGKIVPANYNISRHNEFDFGTDGKWFMPIADKWQLNECPYSNVKFRRPKMDSTWFIPIPCPGKVMDMELVRDLRLVPSPGGSAINAIVLAKYMGFKSITLVGIDGGRGYAKTSGSKMFGGTGCYDALREHTAWYAELYYPGNHTFWTP